MSYVEKLTKLLGRDPLKDGLIANMKAMNLRSIEASAKNLFEDELQLVPGQKVKAKKLGLI